VPEPTVTKEEERKTISIYKFQIDKQYKIELNKPDQAKKLTLAVNDC